MLITLIFLFFQLSLTSAVSCPAGGTYDNNFQKCYIYNSQPAAFLEAESTCRSIGGNLAEIRNGFENSATISEFVNSKTNGIPPSTYWIGANLLLAPLWTWTTDALAQYTNWAPDEPADPSSFECGSVRTNGNYLWKKELCYSTHPFVCSVAPIPDPSDSPCDPGYFQYGNQCFKLFTHFTIPLNYYDSSAFCRLQGNATLPKITSQGMQEFVSFFL